MENAQSDTPNNAAPVVGSTSQPSEPVSPAVTPTQPQTPAAKPGNSFKKLLPLLGLGILAIIACVVGYYLFVFESPVKVASSAEDINSSFVKYSRLVKRAYDHLEEESGSSADGLERYAAQGEDLMSELRGARVEMDKTLDKSKSKKLDKYLLALNDYLSTADKLSRMEEENVKISNGMIKPTRMYEELTIELSGASNYMFSDTKKYAEILVGGVAELKKIKGLFQLIEVGDPFDEYNNYTVKTIDIELKYFEDLMSAVENRDSAALTNASKVYAEEMQRNGSDAARVSDKIKNDIKELGQKLEEQKEDVNAEYNNLKSQYKF